MIVIDPDPISGVIGLFTADRLPVLYVFDNFFLIVWFFFIISRHHIQYH